MFGHEMVRDHHIGRVMQHLLAGLACGRQALQYSRHCVYISINNFNIGFCDK